MRYTMSKATQMNETCENSGSEWMYSVSYDYVLCSSIWRQRQKQRTIDMALFIADFLIKRHLSSVHITHHISPHPIWIELCLTETRSAHLYLYNKKHLKNVGPIRHCEPPHAHSPGVASGTVARRLRIDIHDDDDNAWQTGPLWPHGMGPKCKNNAGWRSIGRDLWWRCRPRAARLHCPLAARVHPATAQYISHVVQLTHCLISVTARQYVIQTPSRGEGYHPSDFR